MGLFDVFGSKGNVIDLSSSHISKVIEVKQLLDFNASKIKALLVSAGEREVDALEQAYIDIKYANPVVNEKVKELDNQISRCLDDLKLLYAKRMRSELTISNKINNLLELIQERQALE